MFGLGGIRKLNDGFIAKQAAHEAQLNRAREHADRAADEALANYKCGGTVRPPLVIGIDDNGEAITLP